MEQVTKERDEARAWVLKDKAEEAVEYREDMEDIDDLGQVGNLRRVRGLELGLG